MRGGFFDTEENKMIKLKDLLKEEYDFKSFNKALSKEVGRSKKISKLKFVKYPYKGEQDVQEFYLEFGGKKFRGWVVDESGSRGAKVTIEFSVKGRGSYSWKKSGSNASPERVAKAIRTYFEGGRHK